MDSESKICAKCKDSKHLLNFSKLRTAKDGLQEVCKQCVSVYMKERRLRDPEKIKQDKHRSYLNRKAHIREQQKQYRKSNREKLIAASKEKYWRNRESIRRHAKERYEKYKPEYAARAKAYREANKAKLALAKKQYADEHKDDRNKYLRGYYAEKRETDPVFVLTCNLRARMRGAIKRGAGSAVRDLGCEVPDLKKWLEIHFDQGMTWDNYGADWHIDHRIPLAAFDLTDRDQFLTACNYRNLQPLWALDNLRKGCKIPP